MQTLLALLPYFFLIGSIGASLGLFSGLGRRVAKLGKTVTACEASLQAEAAQLTNAINELKQRVAMLEKADRAASREPEPSVGLSNAARGRVFKLHRSGQGVEHIAQKLRLPKGEVDLLIKVQRVVMRPYEKAEAPADRAPV